MQFAQCFFRQIMDFSEKYNILHSAMAASERIFKLLDAPVEVVPPVVTKTPAGPGRIEFDHVWFAYRGVAAESGDTHSGNGSELAKSGSGKHAPGESVEPDWVVRDVSFTIEPGETVAIVGH